MTKILQKEYCHSYVLEKLSENPNTTPEIMNEILQKEYCDYYVLDKLSKNPNTTPKIMNEILQKEYCDYYVLDKLSKNPNTTPKIMTEILQKEYCGSYVLYKLSENPNTTPEIMTKILQKEYCDFYVLYQLSQNTNTTPEIILTILKHRNFPINSPFTDIILNNIKNNHNHLHLWTRELIDQTESLHPIFKDTFLNLLKNKLNERYKAIKTELIKFHRIFEKSQTILGITPVIFREISSGLLVNQSDHPYISKIANNNTPIIFWKQLPNGESILQTTSLDELHIAARGLVISEPPKESPNNNSINALPVPPKNSDSRQHNPKI